ncbi:MAG TPA: ImmA/IrrE family metallo-endopeptidase [Polyangiaceae bacterium]|nr:ImmA/IrrE family metallo-endopeptidase [Polyangiaceae bacterium]
MRQGEILANGVLCKPWDPERFQEQIPRIRDLCNKKIPSIFPTLQSLCSDCGVAAIVLQAPSGCRASGATRFLSPSKALLLLSFRYLSDDHFWFSFFHEAGHLLLHGERFVSVEGMDRSTSSQEHEANQFAANVLIPPEERQRMLALRSEFREIVRFALRIGVSPGVVVGQLQHAGRLGPHQQNRLKRRFSWEREE